MDTADAEVGQAYHTVQLSTKEMLKNNRRQHYCNMIDLLTSSCKASGLLNTPFSNEELVQFWLGDIAPLMFDTDRNIQNSAVAAMAEALVALDVSVIHEAKCWPQLRGEFVNNYTKLIGEMRDAKNNNWHKIWTLLVQIMDNELLRGCTYINKFLAVVELGFRNPDNSVRSEAFLCWRVLIKIFAAYNELAATKRLRLLLIPLRTSQSRSAHVSGIKLRVWWYLITCLDAELPNLFDNAVEYFLSFLFGSGGSARNPATGLAHSYQTARELALPCLVALWNIEPASEALQLCLRELRLETLAQPSPLMNMEHMQQHWRPMLAAAVSAIKLICQQNDDAATEQEQELLHLLLRNLTLAMHQLRVAPFIVASCTELAKTLPSDGRVVRSFFNTYAGAPAMSQRVDSLPVLEAYLKLCLKARSQVPPAILQRCITLIYAPEQLTARNTNEFRLLNDFALLLMQSNDDEDYEAFSIKLQIWRQISQPLLSYLRENPLEYRVAHNALLVDNWILWPLQTCASFAGRRAHSAFDGVFCEQWKQLVNAGHNANERKEFVGHLKAALVDLLKNSSKEEPHFAQLFDVYVSAVLKLGICKDTPLHKDVFAVLLALFERATLSQSLLEGCLNTLRNLVLELRQNELMVIFDALKPTLAAALQCWNKRKFDGNSFLNEWKRAIQEKFRKLGMKSMANQLKELFKGDDLFVIIPSVWSLNPDKLTDRQKERFAEKSDIPALYNDMSQSQDSSIKPWTPKKVVIAKSKQSELAIGGDKDTNDVVVIDESPTDNDVLQATPVVPATPTRRRQTIDQPPSSTEKYNFRKPRTQTEEEERATSGSVEETPTRQTRQRAAQKDSKTGDSPAAATEKLRSPRKQSATPTAAVSKPVVAAANKAKDAAKAITMQSEDLFADLATPTSLQPSGQVLSEQAKKATSAPETQLSSSPEQLPAELISEPTPASETSPRKSQPRLCNLNSPPDRKQTNNSTSPTLRPKPSAHLTGRGAQLINMIRNKKLDAAALSASSSTYSSSLAGPSTRSQLTPARLTERSELVSTPTCELNELAMEHTSTPIQQVKELLIFSKRLPSPSASPSASILKRKLRCESMDDFESPAMKRKRVSFHDPPVSVTKEYLRDVDETRSSKPKRCLLPDKTATAPPSSEARPALKRRGRLDSIIEIEKFAHEQTARSVDKSLDKSQDVMEDEAFDTLKWNETTTTVHSSPVAEKQPEADVATTAAAATTTELPSRDLAILDADAALELVVEQCSLETVLERYLAKAGGSNLKSVLSMTKFLSNQMNSNDKLKTSVLETLSENHSKEFLDHAVRENLSSVVCDRLNPNSVLEYICAKSKINSSCRSNLLAQVPGIIRQEAERMSLLQQLLQQCSPSDDQLLDLIGQLMQLRGDKAAERSSSSAGIDNDDNVAETAADSSSNL
ncbi:hypothetical protein KR044_003810 [Drosophila immigrans]|nr:hypothetical protein KR044_003810 [Drosophila immigrans]